MTVFFRKISIYLIAVCIVVFIFILINIYNKKPEVPQKGLWENYVVEKINLNDKDYNVILADDFDHMQKGLMFVRKPTHDFDGMVFRFPDKQNRKFWNKNTFEDLKLYWMIEGEVIGTSDLPSIEKSNDVVIVSSPGLVDTVVEIIQ